MQKGCVFVEFCLTRESEALLSVLYREYCTRRKHGIPIVKAAYFKDSTSLHNSFFPHLAVEDIDYLCFELRDSGLLDVDRGDDSAFNVHLTRSAVAYLDNRFARGLSDVVSFLDSVSSIIGWIK